MNIEVNRSTFYSDMGVQWRCGNLVQMKCESLLVQVSRESRSQTITNGEYRRNTACKVCNNLFCRPIGLYLGPYITIYNYNSAIYLCLNMTIHVCSKWTRHIAPFLRHISSTDWDIIKAKMAISTDTRQLQFIKLNHFKLERFKSI